jgi:hypothetical protein
MALRSVPALLLGVGLAACAERAPDLVPGERRELVHPGPPHALHLSEPALAAGADGALVLAFARGEGAEHHVLVARLAAGEPAGEAVRVDPPEAPLGAAHQSPGLAAGPDGAVHVTWSTPVRGGSELVLATSRDGGRSFGPPRRIAAGEPATRGFEGVAVDASGALFVAWIEIGAAGPRTWIARVPPDETAQAAPVQLGDRTCPCCRIAVSAGEGVLGVLWRDEFPGHVRDMVLATSRDGGRSFSAAARVHEDGWALDACPHRGGALGFDARGDALAAWYTEGSQSRPELRLAAAADGARFAPPRVVHDRPGSFPDHVSLALRPDGSGIVAFEAATPVRSDVVARAVSGNGARVGPTRVLSQAVKARGPAAVATAAGELAVAWNEEAFPTLRTVVQTFSLRDAAAPAPTEATR